MVDVGKVSLGKVSEDKDNMPDKSDGVLSSLEPKKKKKSSENTETYEKIISYLNQKTGKNFKANSKDTQSLINARLKENFIIENFLTVIDVKCNDWLKNPEMSQYLRPKTLFGTKFESYLNQNINIPERNDDYESVFRSPDPNDAAF